MRQVILKADGEKVLRTGDPNGIETVWKWNQANGFKLAVPVDLECMNKWKGKVEVYAPKFAQGLLNAHPDLHLVEEIETPAVVERVVDKKAEVAQVAQSEAAAPPVVKKKRGRPRKEETNETVAASPA